MDHHYFSGILEELRNKPNPEVHHFNNGNHPGPSWYLKTVCPTPHLKQIDKCGYGNMWLNLAAECPDKIRLVPHAYDWNGDKIPYMVSVWIEVNHDIIFTVAEPPQGIKVVLVDRNTGKEYYFKNLLHVINACREGLQTGNYVHDLKEIDDIETISKQLAEELKSATAEYKRKKFELLEGMNGKSSSPDGE